MTACQACPNGTYSAMRKNVRDFLKCPNSTSPRLAVPSVIKESCNISDGAFISVGAASCTKCPADKPYTWKTGSVSVNDCRPCPMDYYQEAVTKRCIPCRDPCALPTFYETVPCTLTTNRQCSLCNRDCTSVGEYALTSECPNGRGCAKCNNKPANSHYVRGLSDCAWACNSGFFSEVSPPVCCIFHFWEVHS